MAASGQIADDELAALREHTQSCEECRRTLADFQYIAGQVVRAAEPSPMRVPSGLTSRFIARARSEGIPLRSANDKSADRMWFPKFRLLAELVGAGLLLTLSSPYLMSHWRPKYIRKSDNKPQNFPDQSASAEPDPSLTRALRAQLDESKNKLASK
jgi:hypothetical protein